MIEILCCYSLNISKNFVKTSYLQTNDNEIFSIARAPVLDQREKQKKLLLCTWRLSVEIYCVETKASTKTICQSKVTSSYLQSNLVSSSERYRKEMKNIYYIE